MSRLREAVLARDLKYALRVTKKFFDYENGRKSTPTIWFEDMTNISEENDNHADFYLHMALVTDGSLAQANHSYS